MKWNKGAPPSVGWWPASNSRNRCVWRWWNGARWSTCAFERYGKDEAARFATIFPPPSGTPIEWRDWPKALRRLPGYPLNPMTAGRTKENP